MRSRVLVLSLLVAALGMTIAPAALPQTKAINSTTVVVSATEFKFKLSKTTVPHGKVVFRIKNIGKLSHDFWIASHKSKLLKPGQSTTMTVTLKAGRWTSRRHSCGIPHAGG